MRPQDHPVGESPFATPGHRNFRARPRVTSAPAPEARHLWIWPGSDRTVLRAQWDRSSCRHPRTAISHQPSPAETNGERTGPAAGESCPHPFEFQWEYDPRSGSRELPGCRGRVPLDAASSSGALVRLQYLAKELLVLAPCAGRFLRIGPAHHPFGVDQNVGAIRKEFVL